METKTLRIKPFYTVANRLLRAKINTIEDVKKFYAGVNELASEIVLNSNLISELDSIKYGDDQKLIQAITHILGYGQVIGGYKDIFAAKEITLYAFLEKNPRFRNRIGIIQKEATIYFNKLIKIGGEFTNEDREKLNQALQAINEIKQEIFKKPIQKKKNNLNLIFPEAVQWEKVVLKLKEGGNDIEIHYDGKHIKTASYIELDFSANKKNHKPDRKWGLLSILSVLQNEDIRKATPDNLMSMLGRYSGNTIKKDNIHQTKKLLSEALKERFGTKENPFTDNKIYYEPRFKILPDPMMRNNEMWKRGGEYNDNINNTDENDTGE